MTVSLSCFVNKSPRCPSIASHKSSSSSACFRPSRIIAFLPKKNLESFHSFLMYFNVLFRMLSTEKRKTLGYCSAQPIISSITFCLFSNPFLLVLVNETKSRRKLRICKRKNCLSKTHLSYLFWISAFCFNCDWSWWL